jgi:hypothetical protein
MLTLRQAMNPFRTGQLVMFQVSYDRSWHFFEIIFYIILGIFGGLYGAFVIKWHLRMQVFRKKYLSKYPIMEATTLAAITAIVCYPNMFLRIDMTEMMEILFRECEGDFDYDELCEYVAPPFPAFSESEPQANKLQSQKSLVANLIARPGNCYPYFVRYPLLWMQSSRWDLCAVYGNWSFFRAYDRNLRPGTS